MLTEGRGARRRRALLDAAVRLIGRGGVSAISHRALAVEAGVPLGSTTYYFDSKEDIVGSALDHLAGQCVERVHAAAGTAEPVDRASARRVLDVLAGELVRTAMLELLAEYEMRLASRRDDALRAAVDRWYEEWVGLAERALAACGVPDPRRRARLLIAAYDGLALEHAGGAESVADLRALIDLLVGDFG